jgi:hypothetical protein
MKPILKTHRIEKLDEICFSKHPLEVCPTHTYPIRKSENKITVEYVCFPRHSRRTETLIRTPEPEIHYRLREMPIESSFVRRVIVPKLCKPYVESSWSKDFDF